MITFNKFRKENEDTYGWWHISCSYAYEVKAKGALFNTNVYQSLEETMVGVPRFYPT